MPSFRQNSAASRWNEIILGFFGQFSMLGDSMTGAIGLAFIGSSAGAFIGVTTPLFIIFSEKWSKRDVSARYKFQTSIRFTCCFQCITFLWIFVRLSVTGFLSVSYFRNKPIIVWTIIICGNFKYWKSIETQIEIRNMIDEKTTQISHGNRMDCTLLDRSNQVLLKMVQVTMCDPHKCIFHRQFHINDRIN